MYNPLEGVLPKVRRRKRVRNTSARPKWLFIVLLLAHGRMNTRDSLAKWGINVATICPMCNIEPESMSHLLFKCPISAIVCAKVLQWMGIQRQQWNWQMNLNG